LEDQRDRSPKESCASTPSGIVGGIARRTSANVRQNGGARRLFDDGDHHEHGGQDEQQVRDALQSPRGVSQVANGPEHENGEKGIAGMERHFRLLVKSAHDLSRRKLEQLRVALDLDGRKWRGFLAHGARIAYCPDALCRPYPLDSRPSSSCVNGWREGFQAVVRAEDLLHARFA
jgi:hypothetical protein